MGLIVAHFSFDNRYAGFSHDVRVYSDENGENTKVVLEDFISVLLAQPYTPAEDEQIITIIEEKIKFSEISPSIHNGWHLATVDQAEEFYSCCDDLGDYGDPTVYQSFMVWWVEVLRDLMEKKIAHVGPLVTRIPTWQKEQAKTRRIFGEEVKKKISLREWYKIYFKLSVEWIITALIDKTKLPMSYAFRTNVGSKPLSLKFNDNDGSKDYGNNGYAPEELVAIAPDVYVWLNKPKELVTAALDNKKASKQADEEIEELEGLIRKGMSDDEILHQIWKVTPESHLIESEEEGKLRNYQYEILKALMKLERDKYARRKDSRITNI